MMDNDNSLNKRPTFKRALRNISMTSIFITMMLIWLLLSVTSVLTLKQYAQKNLALTAATMTYSLEAAVVFADGPAATETLAALGQQGQFSTAEVRDKQQNILASWHYTRKDPGDTFSNFISHWLFPAPIIQPIRHNGETIGEVRLTARDSSISHFIWFSLAVLTGCILLASGIAITLTRHLHNGLVEALKNITDVVHDVRSNRNFSRRVSEERIAEFHRFALDFNSLLDEMEEWQLRLQAKNAQLLRTALHDPLTGLANRAAFRSGINTLMNNSDARKTSALLFLDGDNFKYINEIYCNPAYDPENLYSVPYTWGTVGIIYNTTMVDPEEDMGTWKVLWSEKYADKILMFGNSKDAFGIAFKALGYPINAESMEQLEEATEYLKEQKKVVQAYVMDEIFDKMAGGEAAMAPYYAGDYLTMKNDNPDLAFSLPREGSNIFADAMCIPKDAKNKELAEMYINFMLEPEVGLANIEYIGYSTPNDAVYELLPEETKNDPVSYPSAEVLATCEPFLHISSELALAMDEKWTEILTDDQGYSNLLMPMLLAACVIAIIVLAVIRGMRKKRDQI